jgi:hypothetical protein
MSRASVVAIALVALLATSLVGRWLAKATTGEACSADADCRSSHCLALETATLTEGIRHDGRVCTESCVTDLDCPSSMRCRTAIRESASGPFSVGAPEGLFFSRKPMN